MLSGVVWSAECRCSSREHSGKSICCEGTKEQQDLGLFAKGKRTGKEGLGWGCRVEGRGDMERVGGAGFGPRAGRAAQSPFSSCSAWKSPDMACGDS